MIGNLGLFLIYLRRQHTYSYTYIKYLSSYARYAGRMRKIRKICVRKKNVRENAVGGAGREMNDPVSRCTEVIKSRQIFSLSRRVSDTYIILKGLFRGALYLGRNEPDPGARASHRAADALFSAPRRCVSACGN